MVQPISDPHGTRAGAIGQPATPQPTRITSPQQDAAAFERVLETAQAATALRVSKHAQSRLAERGLNLGRDEMQRLEGAVDKAAAKGSRDSLVLLDDLALVVSVRNRTIVTAVDASSGKGNVFTNIDSVVLAE